MDLRIRPAVAEDAALLVTMIRELAEHQGQTQHVRTTAEGLLRDAFGPRPLAFFLVAEADGAPAGYLSWTEAYGVWAGGAYLSLDDLFVREPWRGTGVGRALMSSFAARAGGRRARWEVESGNTGARRFYEALGAELAEKVIVRWSPEAMAGVAQ